jgi:N-acetylmuramoyl-L-alanine amidase
MRLVERPSPNHDARPDGARIDMLVLHYTGMKTAAEALERLCDPAAKVSAHYTIDEAGTVFHHVAEERRAWHAGASYWAGEASVNNRSIGIELVNPGHEFGYVPFADRQIASLIDLADAVIKRHRIPARRVLGHSDVAPGRKTDPGEFFPWRHLADFGIGTWPSLSPAGGEGWGEGDISAALSRFGYGVPPQADASLALVIAAFQRHFRPSCIDGSWDWECDTILASLLVG